MRADFNKLMTEHERSGSKLRFRDHRNKKGAVTFDDEQSGGKESMMARRRAGGQRRKSFGENLNPLKGFLHQRVGQHWDKVFSEINEAFDRRKVINDHIFQHLFRDYVELNVRMIDGKPHVLNVWRGNSRDRVYGKTAEGKTDYNNISYVNNEDYYDKRWVPIKEDSTLYYVHPISKQLLENKNRVSSRSYRKSRDADLEHAKAKIFKLLSNTEELHFESGVWWLYTLSVRPPRVKQLVETYRLSYDNYDKIWDDSLTTEEKARAKVTGLDWAWVDSIKTVAHPQKNDRNSGWYRRDKSKPKMVYTAKKQADRALLRKHNLDGTAEAKDESIISHREAGKY
jgi:hypothetical protein